MTEILSDQQREAERICDQGIDLCESKDFEGAHKIFQRAYGMDPSSAKINSWLGYTTAIVERRVQKGLDFCRKALESGIPDVMFLRNIGKVYLLQNNKRGAIGAFAKGLQIEPKNRAILAEWKVLGFRRKVAFPFLDRGHFLNKTIGKITWKLFHGKKQK